MKSCCCFLWNSSGAKHNPSAACGNGVSQRGCWLCIKVGSVFQGTCQNLADIFSTGKYLALDSCPKTFTLVGKKMFLFQWHIYIIFGPAHMWKASFFPHCELQGIHLPGSSHFLYHSTLWTHPALLFSLSPSQQLKFQDGSLLLLFLPGIRSLIPASIYYF